MFSAIWQLTRIISKCQIAIREWAGEKLNDQNTFNVNGCIMSNFTLMPTAHLCDGCAESHGLSAVTAVPNPYLFPIQHKITFASLFVLMFWGSDVLTFSEMKTQYCCIMTGSLLPASFHFVGTAGRTGSHLTVQMKRGRRAPTIPK